MIYQSVPVYWILTELWDIHAGMKRISDVNERWNDWLIQNARKK